MEITAALVKELRERSGAGMMECKKALTENAGNIEAAADWLRKQGLAKADKKASRVAAEGRVALAQAAGKALLVELNCETDFVGKDANFIAFANAVAAAAVAAGSSDVDTIKTLALADGQTVEGARQALVAKIGENMQVRRAALVSAGTIGAYVHSNHKLGVLVAMEGGNAELAKGIAMHIAAMNPQYLDLSQIPADVMARERDIAMEQSKDSGKPPEILEKMVQGKIRKTLAEQTLLGQAYAAPDANGMGVEEVLKKAGAKVSSFVRINVGEGIEKKEENFADEVMKQVKASQ
ncbi:MAG: elongation factor Ts [Xanthomonadales bacterium]|nr:Elongation factor Ts [Xanthomonadales bacterium]MCC6593771.1 elongation factor Ts [Xanthomonadales bacterium]MCE7931291.1 elongation factor Ts [Xanthomonadales bacterium PRO6]